MLASFPHLVAGNIYKYKFPIIFYLVTQWYSLYKKDRISMSFFLFSFHNNELFP